MDTFNDEQRAEIVTYLSSFGLTNDEINSLDWWGKEIYLSNREFFGYWVYFNNNLPANITKQLGPSLVAGRILIDVAERMSSLEFEEPAIAKEIINLSNTKLA